MKTFAYIHADSISTAVKNLGKDSLALAGGTDLINLMKDHILEPGTLVNIKGIGELDGISAAGDSLRIGANVTITEILDSAEVASRFPALQEALYDVATPQIRNMSTLGGNLCARPRCWYYRNENTPCRKRGDSICAAVDGDNELHAIYGTDQPCVMVHPSSAAPPLIAYRARAGVAGKDGPREIPLERFFTMPSVDMSRENVLKPDDVLTHVVIPPCTGRSATYEVRHKESHDWPLALASVVLEMDGRRVRQARIVLGGVAPVPWRAASAEASLAGKEISELTATDAAARAVEDARPLSGNKFKVQLTRTAVKRALLAAATGRRI